MRTQVPRGRLAVFMIAALMALGVFLYLNTTFGGPTLIPQTTGSYALKATFPDSQNLVRNSLVMYRGFQIGSVASVDIVHGQARVAFTIDPRYAPLPADTIVQVDHRTFLQEAFVNVYPGPMHGRRLVSGSAVRTIPTVEPEDALQVFDPQTRQLLEQGTVELARGLRAPDAGQELNATIDGMDRTIGRIRQVTGALQGQAQSLATLVSSGATVLTAVAARQAELRRLIGSGRTVADTFSAQSGALGRGIDGLGTVLAGAQRVLPHLRPLLERSAPLLTHAAATATTLLPALVSLRPALPLLRATQDALVPAARAATPALSAMFVSERDLLPLTRKLVPAVANIVPTLGYIASEIRGWDSFAANISDAVDHGDSQGPWLHGWTNMTAGAAVGSSAPCSSLMGLCVNPYVQPRDAADPRPYVKGQFPHLVPYFPK